SILAALAGIVLLAWLVHEGGAEEVGRRLVGLGPVLPLALLPYTVVSLCDALGWRVVLRAFGVAQPFARLWLERLAGEAVNSVARMVARGLAGLLRTSSHTAGRVERSAADFDAHLATVYATRRLTLLGAAAWHMLGWLASAAEVWVVLRLLGTSISQTDALIVE